jgi:transposase-like protein
MRTSILGKVQFVASKYDPETRGKAVRLVLEHRDAYPSEWAAITAVSKRLGMNAETLRNWIRQQQVRAARPAQQSRRCQRPATVPRAVHVSIVSPLVNDVRHIAVPSPTRSFETLICRLFRDRVDGTHAEAPAPRRQAVREVLARFSLSCHYDIAMTLKLRR